MHDRLSFSWIYTYIGREREREVHGAPLYSGRGGRLRSQDTYAAEGGACSSVIAALPFCLGPCGAQRLAFVLADAPSLRGSFFYFLLIVNGLRGCILSSRWEFIMACKPSLVPGIDGNEYLLFVGDFLGSLWGIVLVNEFFLKGRFFYHTFLLELIILL